MSVSALPLFPGMLIVLNAFTVGRKPTIGVALEAPDVLVPTSV